MALTHRQLIDQIAAMAEIRGLLWHYCPDSRRCHGPLGFPDLLITGPRGIILAEIKTGDDDTSAEQDLWRFVLTDAGRHYWLWRESTLFQIWREPDLENKKVDAQLNAIM